MANVDTVKKRLIAEMQSVSQTSAHSESALEPSTSSATSTASAMGPAITSHYPAGASPSPPATKGGIWTEFDTQIQASQQHCTAGTDAVIEMRRYSEEKPIPRDGDPLRWWKMNEPTFPCLSKIAKKQLGLMATSVPAERIFWKGGTVCNSEKKCNKREERKHVTVPEQKPINLLSIWEQSQKGTSGHSSLEGFVSREPKVKNESQLQFTIYVHY